MVIATKFGFTFAYGAINGVDSRPAHLRQVVDASLERALTPGQVAGPRYGVAQMAQIDR